VLPASCTFPGEVEDINLRLTDPKLRYDLRTVRLNAQGVEEWGLELGGPEGFRVICESTCGSEEVVTKVINMGKNVNGYSEELEKVRFLHHTQSPQKADSHLAETVRDDHPKLPKARKFIASARFVRQLPKFRTQTTLPCVAADGEWRYSRFSQKQSRVQPIYNGKRSYRLSHDVTLTLHSFWTYARV
jgi:hypothetical protein